MILNKFSYVQIPCFKSDVVQDMTELLLANGREKTLEHVRAVAETCVRIARSFGLDVSVCEASGYLHDISAVIKPADMLEYAQDNKWYIDEAERKYPFLLHQRISKKIAEDAFSITDANVLSAIECHSTLNANPSAYDMALFVADKLSWDGDGEPPYYNVVNESLSISLEAASLAYMDFIVEKNMILHPHKWFIEGREYFKSQFNVSLTLDF